MNGREFEGKAAESLEYETLPAANPPSPERGYKAGRDYGGVLGQ